MELFKSLDFNVLIPIALSALGAIFVLIITLIIAKWAKKIVTNLLNKSKTDITLVKFFSNLAKYIVLILGGLTVLGLFGISVTSFAALLAAVGFAVGLALQGTLSNFSAGVMLLLFRPFKVNDFINVAGTSGKVVEIELFTTILDTPDNRRIIVPNGAIFGSTIENITHHDLRRVDVNVGTDYSADIKKTRVILENLVNTNEGVLKEPAPQVYLLELGDSSINWVVRAWTETSNYWALREILTEEIKQELDKASVGIPFPQMDVHLDGALTK